MNLQGITNYFLRLLNRKYTGKVTFTIDKGAIVNCVEEEKQDIGQFQQA